MVLPALAAALPAVISAAGSAASGYLAGQGNKETKLQRQRRKLLGDVIESVRTGKGDYADLFASSWEDFDKGFAEPARQRFRDRGAPQIQQQYIHSGMQRGTGLDDALARAGVDLEGQINSNYMQYQNSALNRKQNLLNTAMSGTEAGPQSSGWENAAQGLGGYMGSEGFQKNLENIFNPKPAAQTRTGYSSDWASQGANAAGRSGY
tara:strand:+ start:252 stop:872 length:621 start_codon:yes stop_codon:yes gene_type:complete